MCWIFIEGLLHSRRADIFFLSLVSKEIIISFCKIFKGGKCCTASSVDTDGATFSELGTIYYK